MSIDKWLSNKDSEEERRKKEEIYKNLSIEEKHELKKKKINELVKEKPVDQVKDEKSYDFLKEVLIFKDWLNNRTYIKGDIEKIETWIKNIYRKINKVKIKENDRNANKGLIDKYKEIPVEFLDEKTRIALNKKLRGTTRTSSDNYYLKKLKATIKEKLKEAKYYAILRDILEIE
ncbi:MAG: hypothetical protein ACFE85_15350 [Candidatus Hodarchaeota archaeon]